VVVLYSTTTPAFAKTKADIARLKRILDNKRVAYEEVDLASSGPERRARMLAGSGGCTTLPQLHVNGRVRGAAGFAVCTCWCLV
jgi:glutaredoxin